MNHNKNKVAFFLRVSTQAQDYSRQHLDLTNFCKQKGWDHVKTIAAKVSGAKTKDEREELKELFALADSGKINKVLVTELNRLGRDPRDLRNTIYYLHDRKISIVFHSLGGLESLTETGEEHFATNLILQIFAELASEERKNIIQRVRSGLNAAKSRGVVLGRPEGKKAENEILKQYSKLITDIKSGLSLRKLQKIHGHSRVTISKVKKILHKKDHS